MKFTLVHPAILFSFEATKVAVVVLCAKYEDK